MEEISGESGWAAEQRPPAPAQHPTQSGPPPSSTEPIFPAQGPHQPAGPYLFAPVPGVYPPGPATGPIPVVPPGPYTSGPGTGPIPVVPPGPYSPGPGTGPIPVVPPGPYTSGPGTGPIPVVPPGPFTSGPGTGPIPVVPPGPYTSGPGTGPIPVVPSGPYPGGPGPFQGPPGPNPNHGPSQGPPPGPYPGPGPYGPPPGGGPYPPPQPPQGPGPGPQQPALRQTGPQQALTPTTVRLADPGPGRRARPRRYARKIMLAALAAVVFAGVAVVAGDIAHRESASTPTASQRAAAAATGLAQRWERVTAGTIFPAHVRYTSDLLSQEIASRLGIGSATGCAAALDQTLSGLAARYGCSTALRASYADALGGTVYTVGVLVFSTPSAAGTFYAQLPATKFPATGLHPLALADTASARFSDAARQSSLARQTGPYVILVVAGYADGRAAAATGERRAPVFAPAAQLAGAVVAPLSAPSVVNCKDTTEWAC